MDRSHIAPENPRQKLESMLLRAMYCVRHHSYEEAMEIIASILAEDPDHKQAQRLKARIAIEMQHRIIREAAHKASSVASSGTTLISTPQPSQPEPPAPVSAPIVQEVRKASPIEPHMQDPAEEKRRGLEALQTQAEAQFAEGSLDKAGTTVQLILASDIANTAALELWGRIQRKRLEIEETNSRQAKEEELRLTEIAEEVQAQEQERLEQERLEQERREADDAKAKEEAQRIQAAAEKAQEQENRRLENERLKKEQFEKDRLEQERREAEDARARLEHAERLAAIAEKTRKLISSLEEQASTALKNGQHKEALSFVEIILEQDHTNLAAQELRKRIESDLRRVQAEQAEQDERRKKEQELQLARAAEEKAGKLVLAMEQQAQSLFDAGSVDQASILVETILSEHPDNVSAAALQARIADFKSRPEPPPPATVAQIDKPVVSASPVSPVSIDASSEALPELSTLRKSPQVSEAIHPIEEEHGEDAAAIPAPVLLEPARKARVGLNVLVIVVLIIVTAGGIFGYRAYKKRSTGTSVPIPTLSQGTDNTGAADDLLKASESAFARRNYDSALTIVRSAAEQDPDNAEIAHQEIKLLLMMGKYDEGITLAKSSVSRNPRDTAALLGAGMMFSMKGQVAEALAYVDQALPLVRDSVQYLTGAMTEMAATDPALGARYGLRITGAIHSALAGKKSDYRLQYQLLQITEAIGSSAEKKSMELEHIQHLMDAMGGVHEDPLVPAYLALTMTHHGYNDEALQILASIDRGKKTPPVVLYKIAEVYALQAAAFAGTPKADQMRKNALKLLGQAVAMEHIPLELIRKDFAALRERKEFGEVVTAPFKSGVKR